MLSQQAGPEKEGELYPGWVSSGGWNEKTGHKEDMSIYRGFTGWKEGADEGKLEVGRVGRCEGGRNIS